MLKAVRVLRKINGALWLNRLQEVSRGEKKNTFLKICLCSTEDRWHFQLAISLRASAALLPALPPQLLWAANETPILPLYTCTDSPSTICPELATGAFPSSIYKSLLNLGPFNSNLNNISKASCKHSPGFSWCWGIQVWQHTSSWHHAMPTASRVPQR